MKTGFNRHYPWKFQRKFSSDLSDLLNWISLSDEFDFLSLLSLTLFFLISSWMILSIQFLRWVLLQCFYESSHCFFQFCHIILQNAFNRFLIYLWSLVFDLWIFLIFSIEFYSLFSGFLLLSSSLDAYCFILSILISNF